MTGVKKTFASGLQPLGLNGEPKMFFQIAAACLIVVLLGFGMNAGLGRVSYASFEWPIYLHAAIYLGWYVLAVVQPLMIGFGKRPIHRTIGWAGSALAISMGISGLWITVVAVSEGRMQPRNIFMMLNILTVVGFFGLIGAAVLKRRDMAWHSRLMACATIILTGPAWARILPMELLGPLGLVVISALVLALAGWGMLYDRRKRGRIHPAWYWGAGTAAIIGPISPPLAFIPAFANWVAGF